MHDMRLIELADRQSMAFGVKEIVGTLVAGGILFMVGMFAFSKVRGATDLLQGGTYLNTTHYCPSGLWNSTSCGAANASVTTLPANYAQNQAVMLNVRTNFTSGMDIGTVMLIMVAVAGIIGVIWLAFR